VLRDCAAADLDCDLFIPELNYVFLVSSDTITVDEQLTNVGSLSQPVAKTLAD